MQEQMQEQAGSANTKEILREARKLLRSDRVMRLACYQEAIKAFFMGDFELAKLNLRDVVKYGIGYDALVMQTGISMQSINRMLSRKGNPTSNHLFMILRAIRRYEGFELQVQVSVGNAA